jgi:hypothetical protein
MKPKEVLDLVYEAEATIDKIMSSEFTVKSKRIALEAIRDTLDEKLEEIQYREAALI